MFIISGKEIKYGWLGVQVQSLTPELISLFKLPGKKGALVADVISGSPAEKGGITKGDLIQKIDDKEIINSEGLVNIASHLIVGQKTKVIFLRNGKEMQLEIVVGERPVSNQNIF